MNQFIGEYQYVAAWGVYLLAGVFFCLFWWKVTSNLNHRAWRDLFRGIAVVVIYTPWFAGETPEFYAPATMVVMMDLLLGSSDNGLAATMALLGALAMMLGLMIARALMSRRS